MMTHWTSVLRTNITDCSKLADYLNLSSTDREQLLKASSFACNLPLRLAEKLKKETMDDPILRQFVPLVDEEIQGDGFIQDPVGDGPARKKGKLLHKYEGRSLILATSACAMHCRYCFRRHFSYTTERKGFHDELLALQEDSSIEEAILSGGDPLSLPDRVLGELLSSLDAISHLKRIRLHTRFPIGIPERIDDSLLSLFEKVQKQLWFVIHINHAKELDEDVLSSLKQLRRFGPILCQSVFLRGVNDTFDALYELYQTLINHGIQPYYLHQLDRVQGALHFEAEETKGLKLLEQLREHLPGFAIPQYVREIQGQPSKSVILSDQKGF